MRKLLYFTLFHFDLPHNHIDNGNYIIFSLFTASGAKQRNYDALKRTKKKLLDKKTQDLDDYCVKHQLQHLLPHWITESENPIKSSEGNLKQKAKEEESASENKKTPKKSEAKERDKPKQKKKQKQRKQKKIFKGQDEEKECVISGTPEQSVLSPRDGVQDNRTPEESEKASEIGEALAPPLPANEDKECVNFGA